MNVRGGVACAAAMLVLSSTLRAAEVRFASGPEATRVGDTVKIAFTLSAPTDVQVAIVDDQGRIVRRLAAGLLGKNAPAPFQKDSLKQELTWDGRNDDGQTVAGSVNVRVSAGMSANYAGTAFGSEPKSNDLTNVIGLAAGKDSKVYVLSQRWSRLWWTQTTIHVFNRSGEYERTIKPFPADLPAAKLAQLSPLSDEAGHVVPIIHRVLAMTYYPAEDVPQQMAVTPDGNLHLLNLPPSYIGDRDAEKNDRGSFKCFASLAPDGSLAYDRYVGPDLLGRTLDVGDPHLVSSTDGRSLFVTGVDITVKRGFDPDERRPPTINVPAVYRVDLPARSAYTPFFGDPDAAGADETHLSDPRGLATDGKGLLYVADRGNNRLVVLNEKDGRFVRSLAVKAPTWIAVNKTNGALYVATGEEVVKFVEESAGQLTAKARLNLGVSERSPGKLSFALDAPPAEGAPVTLWIGKSRAAGPDALLSCQDLGDRFSDPKSAACAPSRFYWSISSGFDGKTVACKVGDRTLRLLDEDTGRTRDLKLEDSGGRTYRLGPNNQIYGVDHFRLSFRRWDQDGRPLPFPAGLTEGEAKGWLPVFPSGTTNWERDFDVDRAGAIYIKRRGKAYHGRMTVEKFDRDGKPLGTVLWVVSDGAQGPRLDAAGNLYVAESVHPIGQPYPDFFKGRLPPVKVDLKTDVEGQYRWMYGSILKFTPAGGAIWFPIVNPRIDLYPFDGEAKLPAGQSKFKVDTTSGDRVVVAPGEVQGAEWMHFGASYILDMHPGANRRCHCTGTDFDVDDYGRVYYTDQGRFRVVVLDSAGNELLSVGRYGNQDDAANSHQPDVSRPTPDAQRPTPIFFNFFTGLGASDRAIYVGDGGNRRAVKLAIQFAAEAMCPVK
jgi:hypothetical protein